MTFKMPTSDEHGIQFGILNLGKMPSGQNNV